MVKKLRIVESSEIGKQYEKFPTMFRLGGRSRLDAAEKKQIRDIASDFIANAEVGQVWSVGGGFGSSGSKFKVVMSGGGLALRWLDSRSRPVKMTRSNVEDFIFNGATLVDIEDSAY